jgi:SAM-dependent methyltransferase
VWGREYTQLYLDLVIPAQLAEGNLPAFRNESQSKYIIYTTAKDAETIRAATSFKSLSSIICTVIEIIDEEIKVPHDTMSNCFRRGIIAAEQVGAAMIFLTPDLVFADGSFATLKRLTEQGFDAVFVPGLRTLKHGVFLALKSKQNGGPAIAVPPRDLMRIALDNLHPIAHLSWWEEGETDMVCANLYWRAGTEGIVARCFHLHPLLIRPQRKNSRFFGTVDDDYFCAACPDESRDYVVTDSDELLAIELSDTSRVFTTGIPKRSVAGAALWAERSANRRHRKLFDATLRMHTGIRDAAAWERAEEKARTAAVAIQTRLNRPTWQLILAGDPALPTRVLRMAEDNRLGRANNFENGRTSPSRSERPMKARQFFTLDVARWAVDVAARIVLFFQFIRRSWAALYRSAAVAAFGTWVTPRFCSLRYLCQRNLVRDLTALLNDTSHIAVICDDPKTSRVLATLDLRHYPVSSAVAVIQDQEVRFVANTTSEPLREDGEELLVIDRNLFLLRRIDAVIEEAHRVLKPGGRLLVLANRVAHLHPNSDDLFFGTNVVQRLLTPRFTVLETRIQGHFGSVGQILLREWLHAQSLRWPRIRALLKMLFPLLLPIQILLGTAGTLIAGLIDTIDRSRSLYVTSLTLAIKERHAPSD